MENQFRLDGQVALITGATGGLGGAMCRAFAAAGANVALAEHPSRVEDAHRLARELSLLGVSTCAVEMDVTDVTSIEAAVASVEVALGVPDVLVANAGVNVPKPALDVSEEDWDRVL